MSETREPEGPDYSAAEIAACLPSGWRLAEANDRGAWDPGRRLWRLRVRDVAGVERSLEVAAAEASRLGRHAALAAASHRLERQALGRSFWG